MNIDFLLDRKFRIPRVWSNRELKKFAHLFGGDVLNVSGWRDEDKEGAHYRDYFMHARSYTLSNFKSEARGMQGFENEFYLDLESELPPERVGQYDVVFNHTTLEHVYDFGKAFSNICSLSKDIVILVVPFLQEMHAEYGDFWRFTPLAIERLFKDSGFSLLYLSANNHRHTSVYIFAIGSKLPERWKQRIKQRIETSFVGCLAVTNPMLSRILISVSVQIRKAGRAIRLSFEKG